MALTASVALVVPDLPDNDVWFANAQSWKNYWKNITLSATFNPAATSLYVDLPYNDQLLPIIQNIDGNTYILITQDMFTSLMNRVNVLNQAFKDMRTQMKNAGFITNAQ